MVHPKQHITDLSEICFHRGVKYVVISPGSRNAPLIEAFLRRFGDQCISIVDERSAGYFALGLARNSDSPVVLLCTSGTAVLNYGPALAEAYYQRIPLVAITADRPEELIDQQDNQTIRQIGVFHNIVKAGYHLLQNIQSEHMLSKTHKTIHDALDICLSESRGPVHINVPLIEPLYDSLPGVSEKLHWVKPNTKEPDFSFSDELRDTLSKAKNILLIHGQDFRDTDTQSALRSLSQKNSILVIAENISNSTEGKIIASPDLLMAHSDLNKLISPDLVMYSGGQIVSKKLKSYIRNLKHVECWRIGKDDYVIDTFRKSNRVIMSHHARVYSALNQILPDTTEKQFQSSWLKAKEESKKKRKAILRKILFSDLKVFHLVLEGMPSGVNIELGNSSVIRYSQIFPATSNSTYYSNRGVSGIDGCLSAASGTAYSSGELTIAIIGDLSFVYDSNALWNKELASNLRVIVINNAGGNIFQLIDGPSEKPGFKKFFKAYHPVNIRKLAEAFNLGYFCIENEHQLKSVLPEFYSKNKRALLMEVKTDHKLNKLSFDLIMGKRSSIDNPE